MDILRKKIEFITSDWDRLLLVLLFFALPFERIPSLNLFGVTWRISVFVGVAIIIRTLYLLYLKKISFRIITPYKVLALFVLWIFLLIPEAINYKRAIYGVFFDSYVIALAISISLIYKKKYLQPILLSLLSGAVFVSIFGIYQYFGDSFGLPIKYTGLREAYTGELFGFPRVHAASLEPLYFASYLLLPLCLAGAMVISGTSLYKIPRKAVVVIFSLYTLLLLLTLSRGGIYGFIATALLMIGIASYKKITKVKDIAIFVASIIVGFVLSFILINYLNHSALQSFTAKRGAAAYAEQLSKTTALGSSDDRAVARRRVVDLLKAHKQAAVIGIGPGQYGPYALNNKPDPALGKNGWPIVNNETLELLLELGVVGLSLVVFYVLIMLFTAIRSLPQKELLVGATVLGLIGYLMAEAVQYQSVSTLYITHIWAALGLLMGILLQADSFKKKLKKS